ncbi:DUF2169 family type VI secretion system accessory protein [Flocculibacter collagenilyticus]|uniref:DUF2169 family type VI secretion system accessory protein n=1 Tax=Flocculibacter collagenilyticus TaxID=2744479 RepID=UPI0018F28AC7|nr:DUF2169 domain-containing protein [Flocculibacter collagenilyticus]
MLHNFTNWESNTCENWNQTSEKVITVVVKQSFEFDEQGNVFPCESSEPIVQFDDFSGEPTSSSLVCANEMVAFKQGFELYGNFVAYPPKDTPAKVIEVKVALIQTSDQGQKELINKVLRVTGKRVWKKGFLGAVASDPEPITQQVINYESTYGGTVIDERNPEKPPKLFELNPAGRGYKLKSRHAKGVELPRVEYPNDFQKHPDKTISPAGYGPIPLFWEPRLSLQPEIDEAALMKGEYPFSALQPENLFNYAPQDQQIKNTFCEGCSLVLRGFLPNQEYQSEIELKLPFLPPSLVLGCDDHFSYLDMVCDTLVIDIESQRFDLIWRYSQPISKIGKSDAFYIQPPEKLKQQLAKLAQNNTANNTAEGKVK